MGSSPSSNPFSVSAISDGRLPYQFVDPDAEGKLLIDLGRRDWVGQIVGPHGSGKTTLTTHLWRQCQERFPSLVHVTIRGPREIQRKVSGPPVSNKDDSCLFVIDGIERLSRVDRWLFLSGFSPWLGNRCFSSWLGGSRHDAASSRGARRSPGLIVTSHRPLRWLPIVFKTSFDEALLNRLVAQLLSGSESAVFRENGNDVLGGQSWESVSGALLERHGSNAREILMEMYDLYEDNSVKKARFSYQK